MSSSRRVSPKSTAFVRKLVNGGWRTELRVRCLALAKAARSNAVNSRRVASHNNSNDMNCDETTANATTDDDDDINNSSSNNYYNNYNNNNNNNNDIRSDVDANYDNVRGTPGTDAIARQRTFEEFGVDLHDVVRDESGIDELTPDEYIELMTFLESSLRDELRRDAFDNGPDGNAYVELDDAQLAAAVSAYEQDEATVNNAAAGGGVDGVFDAANNTATTTTISCPVCRSPLIAVAMLANVACTACNIVFDITR